MAVDLEQQTAQVTTDKPYGASDYEAALAKNNLQGSGCGRS